MENEIELKLSKKPLKQKEIIEDIDDIIHLSLVGRTIVCFNTNYLFLVLLTITLIGLVINKNSRVIT